MQALAVSLLQFKDVTGRKPDPLTFLYQAKQAAVHWRNTWEEEKFNSHVRDGSAAAARH